MALNPSGIMSIGGTTVGASINLELGLSATANSSIGQTNFRELAKVPTGAISLSDFYGKSSVVEITISSNRTQYTLSPSEVPGYLAGDTKVQLRINEDVYLYSTDVSAPALTIIGFVAGDEVIIVNDGYIIGMGGQGGFNDSVSVPSGSKGGNGVSIFFPVTIENNRYIAGGGGGGAMDYNLSPGGGGAGGGKGGNTGYYGSLGGGPGGAPGMAGGDGLSEYAGAGGGGRILPGIGGAGGTINSPIGKGGGAGGGGRAASQEEYIADGGAGGSANSPGNSGGLPTWGGAGGGGWGASGGKSYFPGDNSGGKAVALNGNALTRYGPGFFYGAIS